MGKFAYALTLAFMTAAPTACLGQAYPSRPVTIVVPFAAGGQADAVVRIMAERMNVALGQPVVVENVVGAGGRIGVGRVARAAPDGYTIIGGNVSTHVFNPAIYAVPYDVLHDFEPVALLSLQPLVIVARPTLPANNLRELIAWLKAHPGAATLGTGGVGTAGHVMGMLFQRETGTHFQVVPYRGNAPAMQDLLAGQIDLVFDTPTSLPYVRAGAIKAYAITAAYRLAYAPDIPAIDEEGLPGFHLSYWQAMWVPKGTPRDAVTKLNAAVVESLADPGVRERFAEQRQEIPDGDRQTPQALAAFHKAEFEKWWPIVKAANIKAE
jgi:tripartite-type tricarboxylate transporter receptor subunit TctC